MFTVIFADKRSKQQLKDFSVLFEPYISEKVIKIAQWNVNGTDFYSTFPDLFSMLKGVRDWRALFLIEPDELNDKNVFDRPSSRQRSIYDEFEEEQDYIIRASNILGGVRRKVKTKIQIYDYEESASIKPIIETEEVSPAKELLEQYYLPIPEPAEIAFISKRMGRLNADDIEDVKANSFLNDDMIQTLFYERNNYPKSCRFMVFDIVDNKHIDYQFMLFKFFVCAVMYAINEFEPNCLQAYRVYTIDCEIDREELKVFLGLFGRRVYSLIDALKSYNNLDKAEKLNEQERMELKETITLYYKNIDLNALRVNSSFIGLTKNKPALDEPGWQSEVDKSLQEFRYYFKAPNRALSLAAKETRDKTLVKQKELKMPSAFQLEDFEEDIDKISSSIFSSNTVMLLDKESFYSRLAKRDKEIKNEMKKRMTDKTARAGMLVALCITLLSLIPLLVTGISEGGTAIIAAVGLFIFISGFVCYGGLFLLLLEKRKIKKLIANYNSEIRSITDQVKGSMNAFSKYLSMVCRYMKGKTMIDVFKDISCARRFDKAFYGRLLYVYNLEKQFKLIAAANDIDYSEYREVKYFDDMDVMLECENVGAQLLSLMVPVNQRVSLNSAEKNSAAKIKAAYKFISCINLFHEEIYEDIPEELLKGRLDETCKNC